jgi:dCTP deaminase
VDRRILMLYFCCMILSDNEILESIKSGDIKIIPFDVNCVNSNSYDVHLGKTLGVYKDAVLDCKAKNEINEIVIPDYGLLLLPGELYLAHTIEYTEFNKHVCTLEGKSSVGRLGIEIHRTAGFGDAGFSGHWTLEIAVTKPCIVYANMPIGQLVFHECYKPIRGYKDRKGSKYSKQEAKPVASKMYKNFKDGISL